MTSQSAHARQILYSALAAVVTGTSVTAAAVADLAAGPANVWQQGALLAMGGSGLLLAALTFFFVDRLQVRLAELEGSIRTGADAAVLAALIARARNDFRSAIVAGVEQLDAADIIGWRMSVRVVDCDQPLFPGFTYGAASEWVRSEWIFRQTSYYKEYADEENGQLWQFNAEPFHAANQFLSPCLEVIFPYSFSGPRCRNIGRNILERVPAVSGISNDLGEIVRLKKALNNWFE